MSGIEAIGLADLAADKAPNTDGYVRLMADDATWTGLALGCHDSRQALSALWYDGGQMRMALLAPELNLRAIVSLQTKDRAYPSVSRHHAPALRLERAMRDLYATDPQGLPDQRPWLNHGVWPGGPPAPPYAFLAAEGESLHQIPVGPVHAGIIEPGHFRFTANGEAVVRLEERLGYAHKGIEALCRGAGIEDAGRIASRLSGDSTVAYGFAFARAVEAALGWRPSHRADLLRGIMAEVERLSHHINDVGAICNDASFVAIMARCSLLREDILATACRCFGHRMMMDQIVPGGVATDLSPKNAAALRDLLKRLEAKFADVVRAYDHSPSALDRTVSTGKVTPALVRQYAAGGYIGRAAGRTFDTRAAFPYPPYDGAVFKVCRREAGDVDARIWVRVDEIAESIAIVRQLLDALAGTAGQPLLVTAPPMRASEGAALVEAFRGDVFVSVRLDAAGRVAHLHARDASWFQWPLLEAAIEGNIVADFPICNKSFNCSYSGHDL